MLLTLLVVAVELSHLDERFSQLGVISYSRNETKHFKTCQPSFNFCVFLKKNCFFLK